MSETKENTGVRSQELEDLKPCECGHEVSVWRNTMAWRNGVQSNRGERKDSRVARHPGNGAIRVGRADVGGSKSETFYLFGVGESRPLCLFPLQLFGLGNLWRRNRSERPTNESRLGESVAGSMQKNSNTLFLQTDGKETIYS